MAKVKKRRRLSVKIILMFIVLVVIVLVAIGFVVYRICFAIVLNNTEVIAAGTGQLVSETIDTDKIDDWLENGADDEYIETINSLAIVNQFYGLNSIYVFIPNFDTNGDMINNMTTLLDITRINVDGFDLIDAGGESVADPEMLGVETGEVDVFQQIQTVYATMEMSEGIPTDSEEYGYLYSFYFPILSKNGDIAAIVGIDSDMTRMMSQVFSWTVATLLFIFALFAIFVILFLLFISRSVVKPVKTLSESMNRFSSGGEELKFTPVTGIKTNDEIEQMSDDFNSMAQAIIGYTDNLEKTTAEKERMKADLDVSAQIRRSLSSGTDYPAFPDRTDFDLYASMKNTIFNKSSFCDCFMTDEKHLFLVIGESAGRSLASMLYAMLAATNIRSFARMGFKPYRIALETNNQLCKNNKRSRDLSVEAIIAQIDLESGVMTYVNAGMPPVLLKKTGEDFSYDAAARQFNLGEMPNVSFTQETVRLSQGNSLIMMSNGVPEMKSENGMEFSEAYVGSEINRIAASEYELKEIVDRLENALEEHRGAAVPESDTSVIAFRYLG